MSKLQKLLRILSVPRYRHALLRQGVPAGTEHEPVLRLRRFRTVVDAGANRGQFALAARHCCPDAQIVAFEPLPNAARRFLETFGNDESVALHRIAVGAATASKQLHVSAKDHSSSLLPIGRLQSSMFPGTAAVRMESVRMDRMDAVLAASSIESPAILKLDVQGYELEALRGCGRLLSAFEYVYAECSFVELYEGQALAKEVLRFMGEHGFELQQIYNMISRRGVPVQGDFLFLRAQTAARAPSGNLRAGLA